MSDFGNYQGLSLCFSMMVFRSLSNIDNSIKNLLLKLTGLQFVVREAGELKGFADLLLMFDKIDDISR